MYENEMYEKRIKSESDKTFIMEDGFYVFMFAYILYS